MFLREDQKFCPLFLWGIRNSEFSRVLLWGSEILNPSLCSLSCSLITQRCSVIIHINQLKDILIKELGDIAAWMKGNRI